jgi:hypothetical protein
VVVVILWLVTLVCGCGARFGALLVWFHFRPHCAGGADGGLLSEWGVLVMIVGLLVNVGGVTETIIVETSCCRVPDLAPEQAVGISHHDGGCSSRRQGDGYCKCLCLRRVSGTSGVGEARDGARDGAYYSSLPIPLSLQFAHGIFPVSFHVIVLDSQPRGKESSPASSS